MSSSGPLAVDLKSSQSVQSKMSNTPFDDWSNLDVIHFGCSVDIHEFSSSKRASAITADSRKEKDKIKCTNKPNHPCVMENWSLLKKITCFVDIGLLPEAGTIIK